MNYVSNCCGAEMYGMWEDSEICPDCREHCALEFMPEEELVAGAINGLGESKYEKVCGLKVKTELVDKWYKNRNTEKLAEERVSFKDIKPINSII